MVKQKSFIYIINILFLLVGFIFAGCTSTPQKWISPTLPKPLRDPLKAKEVPTVTESEKEEETQVSEPPRTRFKKIPTPPPRQTHVVPLGEGVTPTFATQKPISVNIEGLALPAFINEVFGNLLGMSFEMDKRVQRKRDVLTLRVSEPQTPPQLYNLARQVLANYRVAIELQGELMRFVESKKGQTAEAPAMIVEGLSLPEVPPTHRPIMYFVTLKVVDNNRVKNWLQQLFKGQNLTILEDPMRNALILTGTATVIHQVLEVIRLLDQPLMRARYSVRIEPAFLSAQKLTQKLIQVLNSQGYSASTSVMVGGILFLPIEEVNALLVFASDPNTLDFVQQWAKHLDHINTVAAPKKEKKGLFFYPVQHTAADSLAKVLNQLLGEITTTSNTSNDKTGKTTRSRRDKLVVDENRNALLFTGTNEDWARLLPILRDMDKPAKQVLIEATIAEITLTDEDERGIEWVVNKANLGGLDGQIGTLNTLGVGGSGLTYTLSSAGQARAVLNAFTSNSRATILSTPRLMVRSGSDASIDVGTEIPTLTSQATSADLQLGGNSAILQQIQYRRTGVILQIKPIVYAGRRVDLQISQQISEAQENTTSNISSPAIFNRQITTQLSLNDGQSVLLGGLISNSGGQGESGIPILRDIPIIGQLFRVNKQSSTRIELVIMIVPYVIDNGAEAKAISEEIQRRLKLLPTEFSTPSSPSDKPIPNLDGK